MKRVMVRYVEYHGLILMGIFNCTLYNKLIVQNLVENPHKGQMKRAIVKSFPIDELTEAYHSLKQNMNLGHLSNSLAYYLDK